MVSKRLARLRETGIFPTLPDGAISVSDRHFQRLAVSILAVLQRRASRRCGLARQTLGLVLKILTERNSNLPRVLFFASEKSPGGSACKLSGLPTPVIKPFRL
jgi:hypothetical protein